MENSALSPPLSLISQTNSVLPQDETPFSLVQCKRRMKPSEGRERGPWGPCWWMHSKCRRKQTPRTEVQNSVHQRLKGIGGHGEMLIPWWYYNESFLKGLFVLGPMPGSAQG